MKFMKTCGVLFVVSIVFSGLGVLTVGDCSDESPTTTIVEGGVDAMESGVVEGKSEPVNEVSNVPPVQTISKMVNIPAGKQYFVWYDEATNTLNEMQLPDYDAGLTQSALDALAITPGWLYEDLAKKFGWLADIDIDAGTRSTPTFADVDGDGDLDLVTGESGGTLECYENVDNALHYYEGVDVSIGAVYVQDPAKFTGVSVGANSDPVFADLDDDGDQDLTIGASDGNLYYYRNNGGSWTYQASMYSGVGVTGFSTPAFADMDGDLDLDLTIGASDGTFSYYRNDGTVLVPSWTAVAGYYGSTDVGDYANPALADMDDDGDVDLTSGESLGSVKYYRNDGGSWVQVVSQYSGIDIGTYSAPALADMDFNLCYDLTVGANDGLQYYYENTGTSIGYDKIVWTNSPTSFTYVNLNNYYLTAVTLKHRGDTVYENTYADLITAAPALQADEIAFTVAHTSTDVLKNDNGDGEDVYPQVFAENAHYVYDVDPFLDYVDIVERTGPDGDYTTLQYWVNDPVEGLIQYEIPRDIYYWYVVHPQIEDELPTYVDPDEPNGFTSKSEPPPVGRFWRPFFFYHNDGGYPLLKDSLAGIGTLWNCTHNNKVENGAIGVVNQWIQDSWTFTSDAERPHEPVRIYRKHIGRCGEHADITTAAARTALIPCFNVGCHGSDHTWNEFWERTWHQWEPVNTYIDNPDVYVYGWGRALAQVNGPQGDSLLINRTAYYHMDDPGEYGHLVIWVEDASGNPVDGAKVSIASWGPFGGEVGEAWNYTDVNGRCLLQIGKAGATYNEGVEVHISSKYGGGTMNNGYAARYVILGGEIEQHTQTLPGIIPRPAPLATEVPPGPPALYRMVANYDVMKGVQHPPQALTVDDNMRNYHPHTKQMNHHVDTFICSQSQLTEFLKGKPFDCHDLAMNSPNGTMDFEIPGTGNWYWVLSNQDTVETAKVVNITLDLYPPPSIDLTTPDGGELWMGGSGTSNEIWWNMSDDLDDISALQASVFYSTDGGLTYPNVIATGLTGFAANPCYYDWAPTPSIDSTQVRVRVEIMDTLGKTGSDNSTGDFEIDSTAPAPATNVRAELTVPNHVTVHWDASASLDVDRYEVYYIANNWDSTGDSYNFLADTGIATSYQHNNVGVNNPSSYCWQVRTWDMVGFETRTIIQAGKTGSTQSTFANPSGWFMLGSHLVQSDTSLAHVIQGQGLPANWDNVQLYDAVSGIWHSNIVGRPDSQDDLSDITNQQGFWLHLTASTRFATAGYVEDMAISLKAGWNLVPYPFAERTMSTTNIMAHLSVNCPNYDSIEIFDSGAAYRLKIPDGTETLAHGSGFWVKVSADTTWTVTNY